MTTKDNIYMQIEQDSLVAYGYDVQFFNSTTKQMIAHTMVIALDWNEARQKADEVLEKHRPELVKMIE